MGSFSIWHWLIVGALALLLFGGKGKISELMGDVAKGIKSFKKGMAEDEEAKPAAATPPAPATEQPRTIDHAPTQPAQPAPAAPVAAAPQAGQAAQPGRVS
jgi:sec-independent protein translocase protein TatA